MSQLWAISYDIADDKRLRKVANCLENFGQRVQYSVFECYLTEVQTKNLVTQLRKLIDTKKDKLRLYSLCPKDYNNIIIDGKGALSKNIDYHVV